MQQIPLWDSRKQCLQHHPAVANAKRSTRVPRHFALVYIKKVDCKLIIFDFVYVAESLSMNNLTYSYFQQPILSFIRLHLSPHLASNLHQQPNTQLCHTLILQPPPLWHKYQGVEHSLSTCPNDTLRHTLHRWARRSQPRFNLTVQQHPLRSAPMVRCLRQAA